MKIKNKNFTELEIKEALFIYNYFIKNSLSNFEEKVLNLSNFKNLIKIIKKNKLPFILAKENKNTVGLAFVNKFRNKSGYRFTYEHSIYIAPNYINRGYGSYLLKELIKLCKKIKKIKNLIAVIGDTNNISSIKIHEKNGFKKIGVLKKIGFKKNTWIDSIYMQKKL